jgi:hypothetical protein
MASNGVLGHWSSPWAHGGARSTSCEVRASGRSVGPLVIVAVTWRGEPDELLSPGASGVLGHKPLAPRGARRRDRWVVALWRLAARQDTDGSGGCRWGLRMGKKGTQASRVWAVVGLSCGLWRVGRRGGGTSGGGVVARGERRRCSDGEGWQVAAHGDQRGGGWRRP